MGEDPQGESRAFTKNGRTFAGTGAKKGCVRTGFPFAAEAGQQKKNCHRTFLGMQTDEDAVDKANALCFALATRLEFPTPKPCRCSVADGERKCYEYTQDTVIWDSPLHFVAFWC